MTNSVEVPRLSRVEFYRFSADELIDALSRAIITHFDKRPTARLTPDHDAISAWAHASIDVPNGGFTQFFYNRGGDRGIDHLASLLESIDLAKAAALLRDAAAVFHKHQSAFAVDNPFDGLFGSIREFDKLDRAFASVEQKCNRAIEKWIRSHIKELATDEAGEPIDPLFTGSVETQLPSGLVGQYLDVKKGKPNGAYREFFDDGTVRKVVFYKSGKVSGDFWPDGQLKRRESKRGSSTIIEWFYPSGQLQKRLVHAKSGYASEPVCLFHENGQLSEQLTVAEEEKRGPWLKFFNDGSPKLRAEYASGEKLIVHDAWNDNRTQVVKNGTGLFYDDNRHIDWKNSIDSDPMWQFETELNNGIPHGKRTAYLDGVLLSVSTYVAGVQEGEVTHYYNNGRVRSVSHFVAGGETESQSFRKFDQPVPAVLLNVQANERLYTAWEHMSVDEYPRVLNLDKVQSQLTVPAFLRNMHERDLANPARSEEGACDTFDDGIGYFLTVNDAGEVTSVKVTGSGFASGGEWETYPPFLLQLRFAPGRIRGRAVECRVYVSVDHTFVEGKTG